MPIQKLVNLIYWTFSSIFFKKLNIALCYSTRLTFSDNC